MTPRDGSSFLQRVRQPLTIWLCSFLGIGTLLVYAGVPLGPILIAGVLTLVITILRRNLH